MVSQGAKACKKFHFPPLKALVSPSALFSHGGASQLSDLNRTFNFLPTVATSTHRPAPRLFFLRVAFVSARGLFVMPPVPHPGALVSRGSAPQLSDLHHTPIWFLPLAKSGHELQFLLIVIIVLVIVILPFPDHHHHRRCHPSLHHHQHLAIGVSTSSWPPSPPQQDGETDSNPSGLFATSSKPVSKCKSAPLDLSFAIWVDCMLLKINSLLYKMRSNFVGKISRCLTYGHS